MTTEPTVPTPTPNVPPNRAVLFGAIGALAGAIILVTLCSCSVYMLVVGNPLASSSFNTSDIEATKRWALAKSQRLQALRRDNQIAFREASEKFLKDAEVHKGKKVTWTMYVESVHEDAVHLESVWVESNVAYFGVGQKRPRGGPVRLEVDQGITRERASKLRPGDRVAIQATVQDVVLNAANIGVELADVKAQ